MIDFLRKILAPNLTLVLMVEKLISQLDKKTIKEILVLMLIWFRDAMVLDLIVDNAEKTECLINIDRLAILEKFINNLEPVDYENVIRQIEKAMELIDKNVYLNVILLQLVFELKKNLRRKLNV